MIQVAQQIRASYPSFLANTEDDPDGEEEEEQLQVTRRSKITSGKLRSDTTAVKHVLWPHELVFTPKSQPMVYESMPSMAFVNGYLTIMSLQKDTLREKMAIHLQEMMDDGETFRWPVVRVHYARQGCLG